MYQACMYYLFLHSQNWGRFLRRNFLIRASILRVQQCVIWGLYYLFLLVGMSNLQNWGRPWRGWGSVLSHWHPIMYIWCFKLQCLKLGRGQHLIRILCNWTTKLDRHLVLDFTLFLRYIESLDLFSYSLCTQSSKKYWQFRNDNIFTSSEGKINWNPRFLRKGNRDLLLWWSQYMYKDGIS